MSVRIVVDSAANLPPQVARHWDITVLDVHTTGTTTAGLSALELCAAYARQLERGGDAGVVALHVPKELSQTWSAAVQAAALFDATVRVVDTPTVGAAVGLAAVAAAEQARAGADLDACYHAAVDVLDRSATWLYLHRLDELRRSGRMSAATAVMSTALATKPIMAISRGKVELATKTRTQSKAFTRLTDLVSAFLGDRPGVVALQEYEAREATHRLAAMLEAVVPAGSTVLTGSLTEALAAHSGPGAIGVSVVPEATAAHWPGAVTVDE